MALRRWVEEPLPRRVAVRVNWDRILKTPEVCAM